MSPEEIGFIGCHQVIGVRRQVLDLTRPEKEADDSLGIYLCSCTIDQHDDTTILGIIRGHWSAIENGTHYRRDVTLGEDACRAADRGGAMVLASLRNLAIGLYELARERGRTEADSLRSWVDRQTFTSAWQLVSR